MTTNGEYPLCGELTVGSLFSGIGGLDLGLERAGMRVIWQSEIDAYASKVLVRHWPEVTNLGDITMIEWSSVERPDLICGGFPCQDISRVGRRAGVADGAKSGLWRYMHRAIAELGPDLVLIENSTSITKRGLDVVLADLDASGFDAEWDCLPAAAFGAPHIRDRFYLVAYARGGRYGPQEGTVFAGRSSSQLHGGWTPEPRVGRVADGLPNRVDMVRTLGNAVVPAVAEWLGHRIIDACGQNASAA